MEETKEVDRVKELENALADSQKRIISLTIDNLTMRLQTVTLERDRLQLANERLRHNILSGQKYCVQEEEDDEEDEEDDEEEVEPPKRKARKKESSDHKKKKVKEKEESEPKKRKSKTNK